MTIPVPVPPNPTDVELDRTPEGRPGAGAITASPPPNLVPPIPDPTRGPPPSFMPGAGPTTVLPLPSIIREPPLPSYTGKAAGGPTTLPAPPRAKPETPVPSCNGRLGGGAITAATPPRPEVMAEFMLVNIAPSTGERPGAGATTLERPRLTPAAMRTGPFRVGDGPTTNAPGAATRFCSRARITSGGGATIDACASRPFAARLVRSGESMEPKTGAAGKGARSPASSNFPEPGILTTGGAAEGSPPPPLTTIGAGRAGSLPPLAEASAGGRWLRAAGKDA